MTNFIEQAKAAVRNWADGASDSQPERVNPSKKQAPIPFAQKYKPAKNPVKLPDSQFNALSIGTGLPNVGRNELKLAISLIEAEEVNQVNLANKVREVISHWRSENTVSPDEAARAKLMGSLPAVLEVNTKMEAARLAQEEAEQAGAELTKAWRDFEELPKKFEKVQGYLANVTGALADLESPAYDQQIRELMRQIMRMFVENSNLEDARAARIVGQLPNLLLERDTVPFKREVHRELKAEYESELERLKSENTRLAKALGTEPHKLSK